MLYFFLSYAHGDDDSYVIKFYRDLCREVRLVAAESGREVGFIDTGDPEPGGRWSSAVNEALSTCRSVVALYSPRYFLSERCGKEWSVFTERLRRHERETGERPPALVPVLWGRTRLPATVAVPAGGVWEAEQHHREGVRQLIRLRSRRERYLAYVSSLAHRIVAMAHTSPLKPAEPTVDLASAVNAFDVRDPTSRSTGDDLAPALRANEVGRQHVHFVVAAGTRDEMGTLREDVRFYGDTREDWAPFRPALSGSLGEHARAVAAQRLFGSDVTDVYTLRERLDMARRNNEIVVLIVDAWATQLETYRRTLAEFDERAEPTVAVLVPSSRDDAETARHRGELRYGVYATFPNNTTRHDRMFRPDIESYSNFDVDLMAGLEEARNRIFRRGRVFQQPSVGQPASRPILEGP
jgi:FxsC-like protein